MITWGAITRAGLQSILIIVALLALLVWLRDRDVRAAVPASLLQLQGTNMNPSVVTNCGTVPPGFPANNGIRAPLTIDHMGNLCTTGGTGGGGGTSGPTISNGCYVKAGTGTLNNTTNHAVCKPSSGIFTGIRAIRRPGTMGPAFVKMYNRATNVSSCSDTMGFVESIPVPENPEGAGFIDAVINIQYPAGLAYCVVGGPEENNNAPPPAGIFITIRYN